MICAEEKEYYSRQLILPGWGLATQLKLKNSSAVIVGAGALGCAVLQVLARCGVGRISLIDDDIISISNLQRQSLFNVNDVGRSKAHVAADNAQKINPYITVEGVEKRCSEDNAADLFANANVVIDCSDNFKTKYLINDTCFVMQKPLVFGAIEAHQGQVAVFCHRDTFNYRDIFPEIPASANTTDCNTIGVAPHLPLLVGSIQAQEAIKILSGAEALDHEMLLIDSSNNNFNKLKFAFVDGEQARVDEENETITVEVSAILPNQLREYPDALIIDVRSEYEHSEGNAGGIVIPFYEIEERLNEISTEKNVITYCNSGHKAEQAANLISFGKKIPVYFVKGNLQEIQTALQQ